VFDWKEYHKLGVWLAGNPVPFCIAEATLRSSVSRLYYGAYRVVQRHCEEHTNYEARGHGDDHSALRRHLKSKRWNDLARALQSLQEWREFCDYQDDVQNLAVLVSAALEAAEEVHNFIEGLN
jgi:hypothetical protein